MPPAEPDRIAAVILAAGMASRFGGPKMLARVGERTMLEAVVDLARASGLDPVIVVVPPGLAVPAQAVAVVNDRPQEGMSRSLRLGIGAIPPEVSAGVILLGDQPTLPAGTVRAVVAARGRSPVIAAEADGHLAPPVLLERRAFGALAKLSGDAGLRELLRSGTLDVARVRVGEHPIDVDRPADLERLRRAGGG